MKQLEQAGYRRDADRNTYPAPEQAAEQRVEAQKGVEATSYGPSMSGTAASGMRMEMTPPSTHSVYFGH
jgi:hypothetical protein